MNVNKWVFVERRRTKKKEIKEKTRKERLGKLL